MTKNPEISSAIVTGFVMCLCNACQTCHYSDLAIRQREEQDCSARSVKSPILY